MLNAIKKHDILICIDSDGTVMDTMTIKHLNCFGPCFIEIFDIKENVDDILTHWNNTNLYTITRGINRFQGLKEILEYINNKYNISFEGFDKFANWVDNTPAFSVALLKEELVKYPDNIVIKKAIEWSNLVNEKINLLPPSKAFDNVLKTLITLSKDCDLLGVSSANKAAVIEEWTRLDLKKYFMDVACQDEGSKSAIISKAKKLGYQNENIIMLGDALGDLKAAKDNDVLFYPIIPSKEASSWDNLNKNVSKLIINQTYKNIEKEYIDQFIDFLNGGK